MKRLLILLILLFALPSYAQQCTEDTPCPELARLSPAMMGSTPAAECVETTPESQTTQIGDYQILGGSEMTQNLQHPYTASATGTVKTLYVKLLKNGSPTFTITVYLCATGNGTTQIGACTAADATYNSADLTTSYQDIKFQFAAGFGQTATTVYHVRLKSSAYQDASNRVRWGCNGDFASPGCYADADAAGTWTAADTTCQHNFILKNCLE